MIKFILIVFIFTASLLFGTLDSSEKSKDVSKIDKSKEITSIQKSKPKIKKLEPVVFPDWIKSKVKIVKKDGKVYFHVLGVSTSLGDKSMTRTSSADNARVNLSFFLKTTIKSTASVSKNGDKLVVTEKMTKMKYSGSKIIKHWVHPNNKSVYSLLEASVDAINKNNNNIITQEMIDKVNKKADKSYKELNKKLNDVGGF